MKRKLLVWGGALALAAAVAAAILWRMAAPAETAAAQLAHAQKVEAQNAVRIAELKAAGSPEELAEAARLRGKTAAEFAAVKARFPQAREEAEEADYALLRMDDAEATSPQSRIDAVKRFLDEHTTSTRAADLRWKVAELTDKELKKPLDAIRRYEEFATDFPKDERAAEAVFRSGAVYEEIKEFPRAVEAYRRVVKDYPTSPMADQAQFRIGTLLADKMEKKAEAAKEFEKVEKQFPKSRLAGAAAGERKRLEHTEKKSEAEQARDEYYGGVREVDMMQRLADKAESAEMRRIRAQRTDLVHEDVTMELAPADGVLTATVRMKIATKAAAPGTTESLGMQLAPSMKVSGVSRDGRPAKFEADDGYVFVELGDSPVSPGTTETFEIVYTGKNPENWGGEITSGSTHLINHLFIPLLDLGDNFTSEFRVTVPEGCFVATQGEALGVDAAGDGRATWKFRQEEPVWNHAFAAGAHRVSESVYECLDGATTIALTVALFPDTTATLAQRYLDELPRILRFYEERLGPYPYAKLTVAQVQSFPGGLGSPGLILVGPPGFERDDAPAQFLAHEVAHMWFGNLLTLDLSPESIPWLSEGFAQYWDALYHESRNGATALTRLMRSRAETYYAALTQVKDRPLDQTRMGDPIYAALTYEKGAFVLHALRGVLGSEKFFSAMRRYVDDNRGRVVTVGDFRSAAEEEYGEPLGWFFDQWVRRAGMPRWRINRASDLGKTDGAYRTEVVVEQVGEPFRMPVQLEIETKNGKPARQLLTLQEAMTTVTVSSESEPVKAALDPDYWVLKHPRHEENEKAVTRD